jgi:hypothetical protein
LRVVFYLLLEFLINASASSALPLNTKAIRSLLASSTGPVVGGPEFHNSGSCERRQARYRQTENYEQQSWQVAVADFYPNRSRG